MNAENWRIKLSLFLNYFVFAILLNSVGTVILQVQNNYDVSKSGASILEPCKDLSIAIVSFLVASFIVRFGYKRSMLLALAVVTGTCLLMPTIGGFFMTKMLFIAVGASFALIKIGVFATIGIVAPEKKEHASLMSFVEGMFMVGVLTGNFIFAAYVNDADPKDTSWLNVYYLLAGITAVAFLLLLSSPLDESAVHQEAPRSLNEDFMAMIRLMAQVLVIVFVASAFLYVLIEQSIMSWLPTFNNKVLQLPPRLAIQMASIMPAATAIGRLLSGLLLRKIDWYKVLMGCLLLAVALVLLALPLAKGVDGSSATGWGSAPLAAFIFPLIGLLLAPIYPAINSAVLSALPVRLHAPMSGLIIVFSALGGTFGSLITGHLFEAYGGQVAFYFSLIPISLLMISLFFFNKLQKQELAKNS
ncbi:MAG: MFS transporter [Bacteroidetes bacterium]|nr:MFS transporter [Bacteroidota bacterium]